MPANPLPLDAAARDELAPDAATPVGEAPTLVEFDVEACAHTGDIGCMDCIEGQCRGVEMEPVYAICHRCTRCGEDDVYGELLHLPDCPLYVEPEIPL